MGGYFGGALSGLGQGLMTLGETELKAQEAAADEQRKADLAAAAAKTKAADDKAKAAWEATFKIQNVQSTGADGSIMNEYVTPTFDSNYNVTGFQKQFSSPNPSYAATAQKDRFLAWKKSVEDAKEARQAPLDAALLRQRNNSAALSAFRLRQLQAGAAPPPAAGDDEDGAAPPQSAPPQSATLGNLGAGGFNMSAGAGLGAPSIPSAHAVGRKVDPATGKVLILMSDGTVQQQ